MTHRLKSISRHDSRAHGGRHKRQARGARRRGVRRQRRRRGSASGSVAGGHCPKDWTAAEAVIPAPAPPVCHALKTSSKGSSRRRKTRIVCVDGHKTGLEPELVRPQGRAYDRGPVRGHSQGMSQRVQLPKKVHNR
ncbi:hypothetical protein B0H14DRAFT_2629803 [Mycena olivaceomarginata]|nr:hypothetical protein B0H14DRAFT_2629803 [Mycena olivaceomarginata]